MDATDVPGIDPKRGWFVPRGTVPGDTPPPGPLADLGAAWLGRDIATGRPVAHPHVPGLPHAVSEITRTARRYGFHATLKPPFRLGDHATPDGLAAALEAMCHELAPAPVEGLKLGRIGDFLALLPVGDTGPADRLAAQLLRGLDAFRAPSEADELARRRAAGLNERQEALLARWGYPYVLDEYRFHLTLTDRLGPTEIGTTQHLLTPLFARVVPARLRISEVTLAGEDAEGKFVSLHRFPLGGAAVASGS